MKIHGAGSAGIHLAHAARRLGWDVVVCDIDPRALDRMQRVIYPARYGAWDEGIQLVDSRDAPHGGFDMIIVATPPEAHMPLLLSALEERPRAVIVEKPACPPSLELAQEAYDQSRAVGIAAFVGYTHAVSAAVNRMVALLGEGAIGEVHGLDVEFREHWGGIFAAHPWLRGPADSYLGSWERGGGASGEHSHAVHLWLYLAAAAGQGRVAEIDARLRYRREERATYDSVCLMTLCTNQGLVGRVAQDVTTVPVRKSARITGTEGTLEWTCGYGPQGDSLVVRRAGGHEETLHFPKARADDFIQELAHIEAHLGDGAAESPISFDRGLDAIRIVAAAHLAERHRRRVAIDHRRGYTPSALCGAGREECGKEVAEG